MGILQEYKALCAEYEAKYGPRTVVLMQIGSFYEMYEYRDESSDKSWGHAMELAGILNMVLTRKNKSEPHSEENAYMIGFPCIVYEKNRDVLLQANYTLIRIDQTGKSGAKIDRNVAEIVSPATEIDSPNGGRLVCLYLESTTSAVTNLDSLLIQAGVASLEIITGNSIVSEFYSSSTYPISAIQEVYRFLVAMNPREMVVYTEGIPASFQSQLTEMLDLHRCSMINWRESVPPDTRKIPHQLEILSKIFSNDPSIRRDQSFIEELNLERYQVGRLSYILLLQYCYDHNPLLLSKLTPPVVSWGDTNQHLVLTHNAILQLDLIPPTKKSASKFDSIYSVINFTTTPMGRRYLRDLLLNPLTDIKVLNSMYDGVQTFIDHGDVANQFREYLRKLGDLERLHRKVLIGSISPMEMSLLLRNYLIVMEMITVSITDVRLKSLRIAELLRPKDIEILNLSMQFILHKYHLDRLESTKMTKDTFEIDLVEGSILHPGANPTHDSQMYQFNQIYQHVQKILDHLNGFLKGGSGKFLEFESDESGFFTTPTKGNLLMRSGVSEELVGHLEVRPIKTQVLLTSSKIMDILSRLDTLKLELLNILAGEYSSLINYMATYTAQVFPTVTYLMSYWDVLLSHATVATKYGYFRPTLVSAEKSFLTATDLRHPLVERLLPYIPNDVSLGDDHNGILLYGLNSAGKSTLVKSIGVNVVMAQIGMFVPSRLNLCPFKKIITRLSGHDDLLKGQSSFVVEMSELRTILRQADSQTLVLGDELCRGTESISGASLTLATLKCLYDRKVCHIFSTHLHDLPKNSYLVPIQIYHLSTHYDPVMDRLIYDRKLQSGPGESLYGVEVARSLHLDPEFLDLTLEIRRSILGESEIRKSRYSSKIYLRQCLLCGGKSNLQTHHLMEQHLADSTGLITPENGAPIRKNSEHNLVVLCSECHQQLHSTNRELKVTQTSDGLIFN